jgi:F0F1-type ATP synthase membrane subunit c/vacuolar-type H+-ATPase subunit K
MTDAERSKLAAIGYGLAAALTLAGAAARAANARAERRTSASRTPGTFAIPTPPDPGTPAR